MEIAGRTVIVTGGAGPGCGSAISRCFALRGAKVVIADIDDARGERLTHAAIDAMRGSGGAIVNVGSTSSLPHRRENAASTGFPPCSHHRKQSRMRFCGSQPMTA